MTGPAPWAGARVEERIEVSGVVQGVGFRPFVHRLATELGLDGWVGNDPALVFIEVAGPAPAVDELVHRLRSEAPPLARVDRIDRHPRPAPIAPSPPGTPADGASGTTAAGVAIGPGFSIAASEAAGDRQTLVPPDTAVCDDCLAELFDPADRRHRHPFITCTNCGPRFTIITGLPYDRPSTTMAGFPMCPACAAEYADPADRRYHAQPIACPHCGPTLSFQPAAVPTGPTGPTGPTLSFHPAAAPTDLDAPGRVAGARLSGEVALAAARAALRAGRIVAVKGLGGFHLACDATDPDAVARLRARKHRPDKPLAVMVASLDQARDLAEIDEEAGAQLRSPARPIVLVPARRSALAPGVAPGNPLVGVMLAYTPVHHLLLADGMPPLVMTSANHGGEPIIHRDDDASARLGTLCDAVLTHDRPIEVPCDDSVVRVVGGDLLPVRRARGYAPLPVALPAAVGAPVGTPVGAPVGTAADGPVGAPVGTAADGPAVLAVGGELKNTFCLAVGGRAWVSQHLGDMENYETLLAFERTVDRFTAFYRTEPQVLAVDAHPGYATTRWARRRAAGHGWGAGQGGAAGERDGLEVVEVQHHHAHVAAVMAEHGLDPERPVLGFAFDGTGYGPDGTVWGGEVLVATAAGFRRAAHLAPVPLPGGDAAVRNPYRVALAHLWAADLAWDDHLAPVAELAPGERELLARALDRGTGCVPTTSMGRLFDAVASLCGLRHRISFEAQAAIDLELAAVAWAATGAVAPGPDYRFGFDGRVLDPAPVLAAAVADLRAGVAVGAVAHRFHRAVADVVATAARHLLAADGLDTVVLTGGVFQNVLVTELCRARLAAVGVTPLTHRVVPPNDGGLALGQAWVALHRPARSRILDVRGPAGPHPEEA